MNPWLFDDEERCSSTYHTMFPTILFWFLAQEHFLGGNGTFLFLMVQMFTKGNLVFSFSCGSLVEPARALEGNHRDWCGLKKIYMYTSSHFVQVLNHKSGMSTWTVLVQVRCDDSECVLWGLMY